MRLPVVKVGTTEGADVSVGGNGVKVGDGNSVFVGKTRVKVGKGVSDGAAVTVSAGRGVEVETTTGV
jgi:hypothetical protein